MSAIREFSSVFGAKHVGAGAVTAGGAGDNVGVLSPSIDLDGFLSGAVVISAQTALAQDETLSVTVAVEESSDETTWDASEEVSAAAVVATGGAGGSTEKIAIKIADSFAGRKRYVRYTITPNLSAADTDTANWAAVLIQGGAEETPVS